MEYRSPDGTRWTLEVRTPGASNAVIVFRHPNGSTSRLDRYAWYVHEGAEARDVSARLTTQQVLDALTPEEVAHLFRTSMPITTHRQLADGVVDADPEGLEEAGGTHPSFGHVPDRIPRMGLA